MSSSSATDHPLTIRDLNVAYRRKVVLWDATADFPAGQLVAIVGPNGAGKSTLLKAAMDLIPSVSGSVTFWGKSYQQMRHRVAYVPQRETVDWDFPVNAREVVAMGLYRKVGWFRPVRKAQRDLAQQALDRVGLSDFGDRQISQLSGGQQQRVFLARALVQHADLYLMDEPFASVDAATEQAIVQVLHDLKDQGKSVVCVHHDLETIRDFFDYAVLLNMRVVTQGDIETVMTRENLAIAYGGKHHLLDRVAREIREEELKR
ncbi:MAG: ABC transporter ATP-binding protein [Verrucomicrobiota bacterium]